MDFPLGVKDCREVDAHGRGDILLRFGQYDILFDFRQIIALDELATTKIFLVLPVLILRNRKREESTGMS